MAAPSAPAVTPAAASVPSGPRVIVGLGAPTAATKGRSRNKATRKDKPAAPAEELAVVEEPVAPVAASVVPAEPVEEKKTSAVEACAKRIRAASKKIQRIVTYQDQAAALNEDQKKAISSKPGLESVVKELQELLQILKDEEVQDEARLARVQTVESSRAEAAVEAAVAASKVESDASLVYLLQFLHLHNLLTSTNTGFVPPVLPYVVQNATASEATAVRYLYDALSNGSLSGSQDSALEHLTKLQSSSTDEIIVEVTFARVNELIVGLTSPPPPADVEEEQVAPEEEEEEEATPAPDLDLPAGPSDSSVSLIAGSLPEATPSFLQASELADAAPTPSAEPEQVNEKVASWADEVEEFAAPSLPPAEQAAIEAPFVAPTAPMSWGAPAPPAKKLDWADDDATGLPSLEGFAPTPIAAPAPRAPRAPRQPRGPRQERPPAAQTQAVEVESDGFQEVSKPRAQSGRGRGGAGRGRGGRGGGEGGAPRGDGENAGPRGAGPRRGGGEGRGRGRGAPGKASPNGEAAVPAPVAA